MSMSLVCFPNTMPTMPSVSNLRSPSLKPNFVISKPSFQVKCTQLSASRPVGRRKFDGWDHEIQLSVRDYELDQFGVVKNTVYANYCQQGLHELMNVSCSKNADVIARVGHAIAIRESSYKFMAPLRSGDSFLLKLRIRGWSKTRFFVEQFIVKLPEEEPIVEATSTIVLLDKNYRPMRIPPLVLFEIKEFSYHRRGSN